jgi:enoyl-CoA hydratase/carnithine racemase
MSYGALRYEVAGPIARITLDRPAKRNAMGPATLGEAVAALARARADAAVRVVALTGAGDWFSAGGDLGALGGAAEAATAPPASLVDLFAAMHDLGKPLVAIVNGHALGGGAGLAIACDVVLMSDRAELGFTEIHVGLWPMMVTAELTRNVGRKRALELMLTGRRVGAAEAVAIGLATHAYPHAELEARAGEFLAALAARSPATIALGLRAFYATQDLPYGEALRALEAELGRVLQLEDAAEGLAAFFAKRPPVWKGR